MNIISKDLLPSKEKPGKIVLLVKGKTGHTITLHVHEGKRVAFFSQFMGMKLDWVSRFDHIFLQGEFDALKVEMIVQLDDLEPVVK